MKKFALAMVAWGLALPVLADGLRVENCVIRETIPGASTTAAYFDLHRDSTMAGEYRWTADEQIVAVTVAAITDTPELHNVREENGTMKMYQVPHIAVNDGLTQLKPGSFHAMLMDIKQGAAVGEHYPLTIRFASHPEIVCQAEVLTRDAIRQRHEQQGQHKKGGQHGHHHH